MDETLVGGLDGRAEAADTWGRRRWWRHCGRGAGPGHRPHPEAAGGRCLSRQPADVRAARGATWLGGDHRRAPELPPPAQARLSPRPESAPWSWRVGRGGRGESAEAVLPRVHRVASLLKRWLLGTHQGGVSREHLDYYLDEFTFRFNRRTSRHRGKLFHRLLEQAVAVGPVAPTRRWSRVSVVGRRNATTTTGSRDLSKGNTPMSTTFAGGVTIPKYWEAQSLTRCCGTRI